MKKFRYDYNFKLFIITNLLSFILLLATIASYDKNVIAFWLFIIIFMINFINSFVFINNQGIRIERGTIKIVDYFWFTKIKLNDLKFVEIRELKKEKKSNKYGFFHEFYHPSTYMYKCDYVYNNGKVFNIIFHLKDESTIKTYFGWMYKERKKQKVEKVIESLENFIETLNSNCTMK